MRPLRLAEGPLLRPLDETLLASSLGKARLDAAFLRPEERVGHVENTALHDDARNALRRHAQELDQARGVREGGDQGAAVRVWLALVSGRWKLIDRFDGDGRRYLIVRRAADMTEGSLSKRERQVLALAALGYSNKSIAYELDLAPSTVSSHLCTGMRRLGVTSRAVLAELLSPLAVAEVTEAEPASSHSVLHTRNGSGRSTRDRRIEDGRATEICGPGERRMSSCNGKPSSDLRVTELCLGSDASLVLSYPIESQALKAPSGLTDAEAEVAELAIAGLSNAQIAQRRGSSVHTVANQVAAVLRKLGVASRRELAVRHARGTLSPRED